MPKHFFDTSALVKHYHSERGSEGVNRIVSDNVGELSTSRLADVEFHSAFAKHVRMGTIRVDEYLRIVAEFRRDVKLRKWRIARVLVADFLMASECLGRVALNSNFRTLDAIQLAVALRLNQTLGPVRFVTADNALGTVAAAEGLEVVDPNVP